MSDAALAAVKPMANVVRREAIGRLAVAIAALCAFTLPGIFAHVVLPNDREYILLVRLMWSGSEQLVPIAAIAYRLLLVGLMMIPMLIAVTAFVQPWSAHRRLLRMREMLWPFVIAAPVAYLSATMLGRLVANIIYMAGDAYLWSPTSLLVQLEGGAIAAAQALVPIAARPLLAALYSVVWLIVILSAVPYFMLRRDLLATDAAVLGPAILVTVAVPVYMMFPAFDPWSVNPAYGHVAAVPSAVWLLYPGVDQALLSEVAVGTRRVVGSCLPSLHVAFPAYFAMVARWRGHREAGTAYAFTAFVTLVDVVLLGRHWVVDGAAAVLLAWVTIRLVRRFNLRVTLRTPGRSSEGLST